MLLPLNFDNIPNYQYIEPQFRGLYYDPDNQYSIPYTYGVVGIIYDAQPGGRGRHRQLGPDVEPQIRREDPPV